MGNLSCPPESLAIAFLSASSRLTLAPNTCHIPLHTRFSGSSSRLVSSQYSTPVCLQFTPSCSPSPPHSPPSAPRGHLHCPPNLEAPPFALRSMLMSFLLIAAGAEVPVPRLPAGRCGKADFSRRQCGGTLHVLRLTAASLISNLIFQDLHGKGAGPECEGTGPGRQQVGQFSGA